MTESIPFEHIYMFDFYDGVVTGLARARDSSWYRLRLIWWSDDQDRRVFAATCIEKSIASHFLASTHGLFVRTGEFFSIARPEAALDRAISELDAATTATDATTKIIIATPYLKQARLLPVDFGLTGENGQPHSNEYWGSVVRNWVDASD